MAKFTYAIDEVRLELMRMLASWLMPTHVTVDGETSAVDFTELDYGQPIYARPYDVNEIDLNRPICTATVHRPEQLCDFSPHLYIDIREDVVPVQKYPALESVFIMPVWVLISLVDGYNHLNYWQAVRIIDRVHSVLFNKIQRPEYSPRGTTFSNISYLRASWQRDMNYKDKNSSALVAEGCQKFRVGLTPLVVKPTVRC